MNITEKAKANYERMFSEAEGLGLEKTDPEFAERIENFAFDEVAEHGTLPEDIRYMAILATLIGCQGLELFARMVPAAMNCGVTPVQIKEIVYQATAYLGLGRTYQFVSAANAVFEEKGIRLPLAGQAQTAEEDRLTKGNQVQIDVFGEGMKENWKKAPAETGHINYWLADNCFGDYYTRTGLDEKQREMVTFCYISAQGGCEPQLIAHARGNMNIGNSREFLTEVISQCVPYIGYPRSLNALAALNKACEN